MLVEFRVENHRSIRDEQVLTMEAGRVGVPEDVRPRTLEGHASALLPVAALYGANASGKSNALDAIGWMQQAVLDSYRSWDPTGGVPRSPFAWGEHAARPSLFEVTMLVDGVRHQYGFVADDERFVEEWLYAWPHGRRQTWFEREGTSFKFGEHLRGENHLIGGVTRPNALYLSVAAQHRHEQLGAVYGWFDAINGPSDGTPIEEWLAALLDPRADDALASGASLASIKSLLATADLGIVDLRARELPGHDRPRARRGRPKVQILLRHVSEVADAWLPLEEESDGTVMLLELARPMLHALATGGLVVVDELEDSLHPLLALRLVERFNDPRSNPKHAQLVFSTHDTNLLGTTLGEPALRRDQVWLTEKDAQGATAIYPLTDYKPRKAENLERGYLQGRYGAIPFLGEPSGAVE